MTFVTMVKKKAFLKLGKSEDIGSIAYLIAISISDASYVRLGKARAIRRVQANRMEVIA